MCRAWETPAQSPPGPSHLYQGYQQGQKQDGTQFWRKGERGGSCPHPGGAHVGPLVLSGVGMKVKPLPQAMLLVPGPGHSWHLLSPCACSSQAGLVHRYACAHGPALGLHVHTLPAVLQNPRTKAHQKERPPPPLTKMAMVNKTENNKCWQG